MSEDNIARKVDDKDETLMRDMWDLHVRLSKSKFQARKNINYAFEQVPSLRSRQFPSDPKLNSLVEDAYQALIMLADTRTKKGFDECQEHAVEFRRKIAAARDLYDEINQQQYQHDDSNDELQENGSNPS